MATINENFLKLESSYLFSTIAKKVNAYKEANPDKKIIRLGIGDVTQPLAPAVIEAMHKAVDELSTESTFRGYGPEQGYDFLRKAIAENDFIKRGIDINIDEVFVNDGAKSDTGNIGDIFSTDNIVCLTDPVYPVYMDSNTMAGRKIIYSPCNAENNFVAALPKEHVDIIYLCYPNNPTGTVITRDQLKKWVEYALANQAIILYDAAYEAYIQEENIPHSIYEIEGAKKCAIEFHSYSKTAGFTGVRCGYTIVPKELDTLRSLWLRRQTTKFNGTSYIQQRAAEAIYSEEGKKQVKKTIQYYMENARLMRETFASMGFDVYGGVNAPYIWIKVPEVAQEGVSSSWSFFDKLLTLANVVGTPGVGFGAAGEGYFRFTAFGKREDCIEALERIKAVKDLL